MPNRKHGRFTKIVTATPTVSLSAYTAKDNMGGKITFANAGLDRVADSTLSVINTGRIISVVLAYAAAATQVNTIRVYFFNADPTASTLTDAAAMDIDDADLGKVIGQVAVTVATYGDLGVDNTVGGIHNLNIPFDLGTRTSLFAAMQVVGAEDLAGTDDIILTVGLEMD